MHATLPHSLISLSVEFCSVNEIKEKIRCESAPLKYSRWLIRGTRYIESCLNQQYILHTQHPWDWS